MKSLFLTDYRLSLTVKNTRLVFEQEINDPFRKRGKEKQDIMELPASACPFDKVIIQGRAYVSMEDLQILAENEINVVLLDRRGKIFSYFNQIRGSDPLVRQKQYDCFRDEAKLEHLRKWVIREKIESQIRLFSKITQGRYRHLITDDKIINEFSEAIAKMKGNFNAILNRAHTLTQILHHESSIAKIYHPTLNWVIKPELGFMIRNNLRNFRENNASDVINGLLNYGFSILYTEVAKQLNALGLDCYYGFYHKNHESHLALYMI